MKSLSPESFTTFGGLLRYLRQREKLTQRELSIAVGYSESQINRLEHNLRLPEPSIVAAQFIPALHLEDAPEVAARLLELAAEARGAPAPAAFTVTNSAPRHTHRTNLPSQMTSFIGREGEIAELMVRVKMTRMLTLTGAGGCGKTRLAHEVAAQVQDEFPDGVWLVEFAPLGDASLVTHAVASVFGLVDQPGVSQTDKLVSYLASKHMLMIFDNCEHVIGACAELAEHLLRACPEIHLLSTSREPLRIAGEVNWRVPSLTVPSGVGVRGESHLARADDVTQYESIRLFVERACAIQPGFDMTSQNAAAVAQICYRLDGIPLAIELAAARLNTLLVEQIAERLSDRFSLLTSGLRTALPRHQTLRATIAWSVDLLTPSERELFARLSVFSGGFTAEAAEAISEQPNVFDLLSNLVDKSLVIADVLGRETRYRLLETIRQYAGETRRAHTPNMNEEHVLHRRHLNFYLTLAEEAVRGLKGVEATQWLNQLDAERDNLRAAINWAFENGEAAIGLRLVGALDGYWDRRGFHREQRELLLKSLAQSNPSERTPVRAKVLNQAAHSQWFHRHYPEAHALVEEALSIGIELDDQRNIAESFQCLQEGAFSQKDFVTAHVFNEKALAIWRELGDKYKLAYALMHKAELARYRSDYNYEQTQIVFEEAINLFAELGEKIWRAVSLRRLGRAAMHQGDFAKAATLCEQSLMLSLEAHDEHVIASCLFTIGGVALARGQSIRAARLFGAADALLKKLDIPMLFGDVYDYEDDLRALRLQLDEAILSAAWAEGQKMTLDEAVELALTSPASGRSRSRFR